MRVAFLFAIAADWTLVRAVRLEGERDLTNYTYDQYLQEFASWKQLSGAAVAFDSANRRAIFAENLGLIRLHNADPEKTWFATVNEFTDWTNEEFRAQRTMTNGVQDAIVDPDSPGEVLSVSLEDLPDTVDWRTKEGVMTDVKNQGACGSCWAFSAVETLESHLAIATGQPAPVLSEQQVVSCSPNPQKCGGSGGCSGSIQPLAFNYTKVKGITLESDYPYRSRTGSCKKSKIKPVAQNDGYVKLKVNDYNSLVGAVATKGPIAISLAAGSMGWQLYGGGVFGGGLLGRCGYVQNHGVQLAGYGSDGNNKYWILRNSWGPGWGEKGFMRVKRYGVGNEPCGTDSAPGDGEACKGDKKPRTYCGVCGIMGSSSYPTGVKKVGLEVIV